MSVLKKYYKNIDKQYGKNLKAAQDKGSGWAEQQLEKIELHKKAKGIK